MIMNRVTNVIVILLLSMTFFSCLARKTKVGDRIQLPSMMPIVEGGKLDAETALPGGQKIMIYIDSTRCGSCQILRLRGIRDKMKNREEPIFVVLDAPQIEIQSLLHMIYATNLDIPIYFDLGHFIARMNEGITKWTGYSGVFLLDEENIIVQIGEEKILETKL